MLQLIRSKVSSILVKALFALLVVSFAIWGIGDIFLGGSGGRAAITVGETIFSSTEVLNEYDRTRRALGAPPQEEERMRAVILDGVIESLVETGLFEAEGKKLGLLVGEDQLKAWVRESPMFRDHTDRFSPELFRQAMFRFGMAEAEFFAAIARQLKRDQIAAAVRSTALVPDALAGTLHAWRAETRIADGVFISVDSMTGITGPGPAELQDHYESERSAYMAPEYREATYLSLAAGELASEILVPESELRSEYDQRIDEFTRPATRDLAQFLFDDEDSARAALTTAAASTGTDSVIAALTAAAGAPVMLDAVTEADFIEEAERAAAFGTAGETASAPVGTAFGWKVFVVRSATPQRVLSFDEARQGIRDAIARERALDAMFELANSFEDSLAGGATIEEAARGIDLVSRRVDMVDRTGAGTDGQPVPGLPGGEVFLRTLFETGDGDQSTLTETPDGGYFLLRVDRVTPPRQRDLAEVRDLVAQSWRHARALERADERAQRLAAASRGGVGLKAGARTLGLTAQAIGPVGRDGSGLDQDAWPGSTADTIFGLGRGEVGTSPGDTGVAVLELLEIRSPDPDRTRAERTGLESQLQTVMGQDYMDAYTRNLRERYPATIDRGYIDTLMAASQ